MRWHFGLFGEEVQIAGNVAVVADRSDHTFCATTTCHNGAVHVFRRAAADWELDATIFHSRISEYDGFGNGISMDGPNRFAANAPGEDFLGFETGAVYIFEHDGEAWRETAEILPAEPAWRRGFGDALMLRGDTLVIGQLHDACWVYRQRNGVWEFDQKIPTPDPTTATGFAGAFALDDDWLAIGVPAGGGMVQLYRRESGGAFEFVDAVATPYPGLPANFGAAVALEQGRMVVGAWSLDRRTGATFAYEFVGGRWELVAELRGAPVEFSDFGSAVAIRGDAIVVGASSELHATGMGAAYAFRRQPDGSWMSRARFVPLERTADYGRSIATDGASVIVGAPSETVGGAPQTGAAHIFDLGCLLCRADLDGDGQLTFFDFLAFQTLFAAGDLSADFDGDGELTFFDFLAFQNEFAAGCA